MEHDGNKSVGRCEKGKIDLRCRSYTSTDFLNYGVLFGASEKYFSVQLKKNKQTNKQTNRVTNKQTDKKQITEIECSKLFISPIISKSHSFIFVMKDLQLSEPTG